MNFFKKIFNSQKINKEPTPINNLPHLYEEEMEEKLIPIEQKENIVFEVQRYNQPSNIEISELIDYIVDDYFLENSDFEGRDFDLNNKDPFFEEAARIIVVNQCGSTSLLRRKLELSYNRSNHLMNQLENFGIVSLDKGNNVRDILIKTESELQMYLIGSLDCKIDANSISDGDKIYKENKIEIERRISIRQKQIDDNRMVEEKGKLKAKILLREQKKQIQKEAFKELIDEGLINNLSFHSERREAIPQDVMDNVWRRDGGKCVKCGSNENLEFDHIIPFSKGGATTYRNMQILCKKCNIDKSNKIG